MLDEDFSTRDLFALMALTMMRGSFDKGVPSRIIAQDAYWVADAMLAARQDEKAQ